MPGAAEADEPLSHAHRRLRQPPSWPATPGSSPAWADASTSVASIRTHRAGSPHRDDRGGRPGDVTGAASHVLCDDTHDLITEDRGDSCSARGSDRTEKPRWRTHLTDTHGGSCRSRTSGAGPDHLRRQGPRHVVPADRAAAAARGRPNVLVVLLDDVGFGASSAFGGPVPHADRRAARRRRAALQPLPHHRAVRADPRRRCSPAATTTPSGWAASPRRRPRRRARARCGPTRWRRWPMTLKLNGYSTAQFGKCHEVPVWQTSPMGPFDAWPSGGGGFETLLRVHRRREQPVGPGALRRHHPGRAAGDRRRRATTSPRTSPTTRELDPPAEGADARQAVLRLLRARRHPRAAPRPQGVGRQVPGPVRPRLGRAARADLRAPEGARRDPGRRRAHPAPRPRSPRGTTCPTSSSRCSSARWRCTPGSSSTPTTRSAGSSTPSRTSASSTTRSSTTSSATTARRPRAP